jgi:2-oxoglutarate ferredoxin oxidoreductase subunit delta
MAGKRGRGKTQVRVYPDWCKGCGICVAFCPAGVFVLSPQGKAVVAHEAMCIDCGFCELHCPDFAVSVTPRHEASVQTPGDAMPEGGTYAQQEEGHGGEKNCAQ